tara:strand:+ start:51 stop:266 length:216 start_codon:yes stop_codon:yes gene_type:complete
MKAGGQRYKTKRVLSRQAILTCAEIAAAAIDENPDGFEPEHSDAVMAATDLAYTYHSFDTVEVTTGEEAKQ